nr:hypothetical protein T10D4.2 - Caenorhabditis elegans [Caenorhabditis elegans]
MGGYALGILPINFEISFHFCMTLLIFLYIYQIASMILCFVRKNQLIAGKFKIFSIPTPVTVILIGFLIGYVVSVVGVYYSLSIPEEEKIQFVEENFPQYLLSFHTLPNFSIYQPNSMFLIMVITAVTGGVLAFMFFLAVLLNIFRMLRFIKIQVSRSTFNRHRAAVWSLIAQFTTSIICFLPPISLVFVLFFELPHAQVIGELLLVVACLHSPANVTVLTITFPPYRTFVVDTIFRKR